MIYFDTSALVKLVVKEPESAALTEYLTQHAAERKGSSMLCRVELPRAVQAGGDMAYLRAQMILGDLMQFPLIPDSLDVIHLATALHLHSDLHSLVAYDRRLLEAAELAGLRTASPGSS